MNVAPKAPWKVTDGPPEGHIYDLKEGRKTEHLEGWVFLTKDFVGFLGSLWFGWFCFWGRLAASGVVCGLLVFGVPGWFCFWGRLLLGAFGGVGVLWLGGLGGAACACFGVCAPWLCLVRWLVLLCGLGWLWLVRALGSWLMEQTRNQKFWIHVCCDSADIVYVCLHKLRHGLRYRPDSWPWALDTTLVGVSCGHSSMTIAHLR